jgi:hypothetical protein
MHWQPCQKPILHAALVAGLIGWAMPSASAGEASFCVHCTGPDQTYVCKVAAGGGKPSDALKLFCVIRTAKEGHHASCSAERNSPACNGVEKVYSYDGPMPEDLAADPRVKKLTDKIEGEQKAFDKPAGNAKTPKTLVELGGRAVNASRQGWRNARGALGGSSQGDPSLPAGESLALEEQNAALAAQTPPDPAVGASRPNRAQRAYRCMISLFRHCGSEPAEGEPLR